MIVKLNRLSFILVNSLTFLLFAFYFSKYTVECDAVFMHAGSINFSPRILIINSLTLFMAPAANQLFTEILKLKSHIKLYLLQYFSALISIGIFALAINQPCDSINGGHYMFIDIFVVIISYLLKYFSYCLLLISLVLIIPDLLNKRRNHLR